MILLFHKHKTIIGLLVPFLFFFLLYIWQVNVVLQSKISYDSLLTRIHKLSLQNQELESLLSRVETPTSIEKELKESFEPVAQIVYLRILEGAVARSYGKIPPP